ncbi:hypothetical protein Cabys_2399 [Caldithrix abyssi DSM 13497]|uniref:Uncharacterized protein n=1 Tax=Caldithrix abyssi DSM 13497 TaxID=880073 RepID=A0A1J1C9Q9_CALAY|nr:hypothetical protein Cabys_2399 [Caldithrix abyssi DSM 13497]
MQNPGEHNCFERRCADEKMTCAAGSFLQSDKKIDLFY